MNYHYERYYGEKDNQIKAEMQYLNNVGYKYRVLMDDFANYIFINANDSAYQIFKFIEFIRPTIDIRDI